MLVRHVALVSQAASLATSELTRVGAALQKQVTRDFSPLWSIRATVDAFPRLEDVPPGYWPIVVLDSSVGSGATGTHLDRNGQPFALVEHSSGWSLSASHECLEMLADPSGNRLVASQSIKPDQGRVEYLVEVCDPSEAAQYGYTVNGIPVSDFYTPHYFDPVKAPGVRYSFTGAITAPRQVLPGGYLSWHDPETDEWWQQLYFDTEPEFISLGPLMERVESRRVYIDRITEEKREKVLKSKPAVPHSAVEVGDSHQRINKAAAARARALKAEIAALLGG